MTTDMKDVITISAAGCLRIWDMEVRLDPAGAELTCETRCILACSLNHEPVEARTHCHCRVRCQRR